MSSLARTWLIDKDNLKKELTKTVDVLGSWYIVALHVLSNGKSILRT